MNRQDLYNELGTDTKTNVICNELFDEMVGLLPVAQEAYRRSIVAVLFHNRAPETGFFRSEISTLVDEVIASS